MDWKGRGCGERWVGNGGGGWNSKGKWKGKGQVGTGEEEEEEDGRDSRAAEGSGW